MIVILDRTRVNILKFRGDFMQNQETRKELCRVFKALSDPHRLEILEKLYTGKCQCIDHYPSEQQKSQQCVKSLSSLLNISFPTISHHLKTLRDIGLIKTVKQGRHITCHINYEKIKQLNLFLTRISNKP